VLSAFPIVNRFRVGLLSVPDGRLISQHGFWPWQTAQAAPKSSQSRCGPSQGCPAAARSTACMFSMGVGFVWVPRALNSVRITVCDSVRGRLGSLCKVSLEALHPTRIYILVCRWMSRWPSAPRSSGTAGSTSSSGSSTARSGTAPTAGAPTPAAASAHSGNFIRCFLTAAASIALQTARCTRVLRPATGPEPRAVAAAQGPERRAGGRLRSGYPRACTCSATRRFT
jgi:hypothetical protein